MAYNGYRREWPMNSGLVYQHMSSHYRRILNAKPAVDTSTPESFKPRASRSAGNRRFTSHRIGSREICIQNDNHLGPRGYQHLIDRITPDKTSEACRSKWPSANQREEYNHDVQKHSLFYRSSHGGAYTSDKDRKAGDVLERDENCFKSYRLEYWPRILKTDATSKLRSMRVYHPPRRKPKGIWGFESEEKRECGCVGECVCSEQAGKEQSPASSRDSAYNGGNSSTTDSRSPTPCKHRHTATQTDPRPRRRHNPSTLSIKQDDDIEYTKFIHEITSEAVGNGHFTDKSLTRIIDKHIRSNLHRLDKERMLREVSKLKAELGITKEYIEVDETAPRPQVTDIFNAEFESWTAHYLQLMNGNVPSRKSTDSLRSDISERIGTINLSDNDGSDSDDSSRGTTIKEVVQISAVDDDDGANDSDGHFEEESIDTGSSSSDEDSSPT